MTKTQIEKALDRLEGIAGKLQEGLEKASEVDADSAELQSLKDRASQLLVVARRLEERLREQSEELSNTADQVSSIADSFESAVDELNQFES
jgi:hypothetical protein